MTKQKLATTNQLTITYNNGKAYTIPRVKHFILADDGKSVSGEYDKQITVDTMTEHHTIKFTLQLTDVVHLDYRAKHGETSFFCGVDKGVIISKTEIRDEDYYERMNSATNFIASDQLDSLRHLYFNKPNKFFTVGGC
uniref:Uncharacterized protein n=1 Tax=Vibrio phage P018-4 TaxID=3229728 RepID=A0AB39AJR2_9CAUD